MSKLTHTVRQLTWHQQSVTLDRTTVCEAEQEFNDLLDALRTLKNASHILWLEASEEGQTLTRAETDAASAIEYASATLAKVEAT